MSAKEKEEMSAAGGGACPEMSIGRVCGVPLIGDDHGTHKENPRE